MGVEDEIREFSVAICREIDEDEAYIVSTQFDTLFRTRGRAAALTDEGQFEIPSEAVTYASLVVTFIGGIFADAVKDVLKEQLVGGLRRWLKDRSDAAELRIKLLALIDETKASGAQREKLKKAVTVAIR